mmetsp:Transcript_34116/g.49957  ORF Transcript_34116/g.49957 Transcript_34116/m.49957 type:complete len:156 (+) Transcript_34116:1680-2147(+)
MKMMMMMMMRVAVYTQKMLPTAMKIVRQRPAVGILKPKVLVPTFIVRAQKNKRPRSLSQKDEMNEDPILTRRVRPKKEPMEEDIKEESPKPTPSRGVVQRNPFLKRRLESPAKFSQSKESHSQPQPSPSAGASLSRMSTFSAQSRERRKNAKNII